MAGFNGGDNKAQGQKRRRPEAVPAQAGLALLFLGRRPMCFLVPVFGVGNAATGTWGEPETLRGMIRGR